MSDEEVVETDCGSGGNRLVATCALPITGSVAACGAVPVVLDCWSLELPEFDPELSCCNVCEFPEPPASTGNTAATWVVAETGVAGFTVALAVGLGSLPEVLAAPAELPSSAAVAISASGFESDVAAPAIACADGFESACGSGRVAGSLSARFKAATSAAGGPALLATAVLEVLPARAPLKTRLASSFTVEAPGTGAVSMSFEFELPAGGIAFGISAGAAFAAAADDARSDWRSFPADAAG